MITAVPFRFDAIDHAYIDLETGAEFPHITGMLARTGWIDERWYTEESSERGTVIHRMTADYDLGALDVASCVSRYRGWLLAYVKAMSLLQATVLAVEEPIVEPTWRFGGRPDRAIDFHGQVGVLEIKSGGPEESHRIQTALQAILTATTLHVPAEFQIRLALYVKDNGKYKVEEHTRAADFQEARRVIRCCCGR